MRRPLGISSTMLGDHLDAELLHEAAARGITHLELSIPPDDHACATEAEFARIGECADAAGITVWSVHAPFGGSVDLSDPDELRRRDSLAQIHRACEVAGMLGAKCLVVHAGLTTGDAHEQQTRRCQSLRSLNCLLTRTARCGVRLAVEYLPANKPRLCNDSGAIVEMLELCDGTPGVCVDTNHANLVEDLCEVVRALADRILTLHLSDNDGQRELHMMPGEGVIDWEAFASVLDEIGYNGPLMYETVRGESVTECLDETARTARELLNWEAPDV